jgi:hypothetical protein
MFQVAGCLVAVNYGTSRPEAVAGETRLPGELKFIADILDLPVIANIIAMEGLESQPPIDSSL